MTVLSFSHSLHPFAKQILLRKSRAQVWWNWHQPIWRHQYGILWPIFSSGLDKWLVDDDGASGFKRVSTFSINYSSKQSTTFYSILHQLNELIIETVCWPFRMYYTYPVNQPNCMASNRNWLFPRHSLQMRCLRNNQFRLLRLSGSFMTQIIISFWLRWLNMCACVLVLSFIWKILKQIK